MTKLEFTLKNDALFKMLFVQYPELLRLLVASSLAIKHESIGQFEIKNPEMPSEFVRGKFCQLDINMAVDGQRVDLEVQVKNRGNYPERVLFNWARLYSTALGRGKKYHELPITVIISIIDFPLFDCEEFHSEFVPLEVTRHTPLTDRMRLHFFELSKLPSSVDTADDLKLWLTLFNANTEEDLAKLEALGVPFMSQAIEAMRSISASPEFREIARQREIARLNEASALHYARQEARHEEKLEVARNALQMNMSISDVVKLTGLTREEVESLRSH